MKKRNVYLVPKLFLLLVCCMLVSCEQSRISYYYEDIRVTRKDYLTYSIFTCNKSSEEHAIRIDGFDLNDNFYDACLVIDKQTKKVWIVSIFSRMEQAHPDYTNFQADVYGDSIDIWKLPDNCREDTLQRYECFDLYGVTSRHVGEKKSTQKRFKNNQIEKVIMLQRYLAFDFRD